MRDNEFELLSETFRKSRVRVTIAEESSVLEDLLDEGIKLFFERSELVKASLRDSLGRIKPCTVGRFRDALEFSYLVFPLSLEGQRRIILIGPFADQAFSAEQILEIGERNGIGPQKRRAMEDYFASVPVLDEYSPLFLLLQAFCERSWNGQYELVDYGRRDELSVSLMNYVLGEKEFDDVFLNMKNMERRYEMENEILRAVVSGSEQKVNQLFSLFSEQSFEKRLADPIRNSKNYCIIMNTLLRKAAEQSGVHPIYLDAISSDFAISIEQIRQSVEVRILMAEMVRSYCKLVRKNAVGKYSPIVKKTVIAISADPSAELNLHTLSQKLSVSKAYLSSIFKKETKKTLTEFIREKRMEHAAALLSGTHLQIQTVALHCGIVDIQYFSKLFKNHTGKTPTQYRKEAGDFERKGTLDSHRQAVL